MRGSRIWIGALVVAGSLFLVACGGGDGGNGDGGDGGNGDGGNGAASFTVEATEFAFDPATLSVPADADVTVELVNAGAVEHDFTIDEAGAKIATAVTETASGTFSLAAGTYTFYCSVVGHREAGMEGTITAA